MSDHQSKLDKLGEILGTDDTAELDVPEPRRGVGEILLGRTSTPAASLVDLAVDEPSVEPSAPSERPVASTPAPARGNKRAEDARRRLGPVPGAKSVAKMKTSSTIPVDLSVRLEAARDRRWTVNRVISSALTQKTVTVERAEEVLERFADSPRAVCSYSVPYPEIDQLDQLAGAWRMSRSQVLSVLLDEELSRLGY